MLIKRKSKPPGRERAERSPGECRERGRGTGRGFLGNSPRARLRLAPALPALPQPGRLAGAGVSWKMP